MAPPGKVSRNLKAKVKAAPPPLPAKESEPWPDDWPVQQEDPSDQDLGLEQPHMAPGAALRACSGSDIHLHKGATVRSKKQPKYLAIMPGVWSFSKYSIANANANANTTSNGAAAGNSYGATGNGGGTTAAATDPATQSEESADGDEVPSSTQEESQDIPVTVSSNGNGNGNNTNGKDNNQKMADTIVAHLEHADSDAPILSIPLNGGDSSAQSSSVLKFTGRKIQTSSKFVVLTIQPKKNRVICKSIFSSCIVFGQPQQEGVQEDTNTVASADGVSSVPDAMVTSSTDADATAAATTEDVQEDARVEDPINHYGGSARAIDGSMNQKPGMDKLFVTALRSRSNSSAEARPSKAARTTKKSKQDENESSSDDNDHGNDQSDDEGVKPAKAEWNSDDDDDDDDEEFKMSIAKGVLGIKAPRSVRASKKTFRYQELDKEDDDDDDEVEDESEDEDDGDLKGRKQSGGSASAKSVKKVVAKRQLSGKRKPAPKPKPDEGEYNGSEDDNDEENQSEEGEVESNGKDVDDDDGDDDFTMEIAEVTLKSEARRSRRSFGKPVQYHEKDKGGDDENESEDEDSNDVEEVNEDTDESEDADKTRKESSKPKNIRKASASTRTRKHSPVISQTQESDDAQDDEPAGKTAKRQRSTKKVESSARNKEEDGDDDDEEELEEKTSERRRSTRRSTKRTDPRSDNEDDNEDDDDGGGNIARGKRKSPQGEQTASARKVIDGDTVYSEEDGKDKQNITKGKRKSLQGEQKPSRSEVIDIDAVNLNENGVDNTAAASDKRQRVEEGEGKDSASKVIDIDAVNSNEDGKVDLTANDQGADVENDENSGAFKVEPDESGEEAASKRPQRVKRKSTPDKAIVVDGDENSNDDNDTNREGNRTEETAETPLSTSSQKSNGKRRGRSTNLQGEKTHGSSSKAAVDLSQETSVPGTPKREKDVNSEEASTPASHFKRRRKTSPKKPVTKGNLVNLADDEFTFLGGK